MEREVFENDSIAALMNQYVVSIKVDREERPDIDRVYMAALSGMTGSGGWPMSIFLTPDRKPFFGATFLPATPRYGRESFPGILTRIHEVWISDPQQIVSRSQQVGGYLQKTAAPAITFTRADMRALQRGFDSFSRDYDQLNAGFGSAPKFPSPVRINFLLRYYIRTGEKHALDMSLATLKHMFNGGMYDHIAGGFHRYSTDAMWHVPHFEKMLYDQAQLTISYLEASQITHDPFYTDVARDVLEYVRREMTHLGGGFYSAQDAESATTPATPDNKKEGAFYTWTKQDIESILDLQEAKVFNYWYDIKAKGNVTSGSTDDFAGLNILHLTHSAQKAASTLHLKNTERETMLAEARRKLLRARSLRPPPHLDDKILVSWNGLMISAFARAYQVLEDPAYLRAAERASSFLMEHLYDPHSKTLLRRYRDGEARYDATLEDYAFLCQGLLDLYEASLDIRWLQKAIELTNRQNALFYDAQQGGFYDITGTDPSLLLRTKEAYDGAEPTGNSIAILNLLRLSHMTDNEKYREMADKSLEFFGERMLTMPQGLAQVLVALDFSLSKPKQIIIAGRKDDAGTKAILREVHDRFIPNKILLLADPVKGRNELASHMPFIEGLSMIDGRSTAYVCEDYSCQLPTTDPTVVGRLLDGGRRLRPAP
jgi:uncharacterized protein YyaL (SSP411 family)